MNSEEKILSKLDTIQWDIAAMRGRLDSMSERVEDISKRKPIKNDTVETRDSYADTPQDEFDDQARLDEQVAALQTEAMELNMRLYDDVWQYVLHLEKRIENLENRRARR